MLSGLLVFCIILVSITMNPMLSNAGCKYAKTTVNIRDKPNIKGRIVGQVYWNDRVHIKKKINKKWYLASYKNRKGYVYRKYLKGSRSKYKAYPVPSSSSTFKSYEDADCISDSSKLAQGRLKKKYHLNYQSGIWMVGNRYCIAVGSYYTKQIGVKIDLVLSHNGRKHVLKCITADSKADKDTTNKHRVHTDGSVVEFIVKTSMLPYKARIRGNVSFSGKRFKGKVQQIRIYQ